MGIVPTSRRRHSTARASPAGAYRGSISAAEHSCICRPGRIILDAIADLRTGADAKAPPPSSTPLPTAPIAAASTPEAAGERRHVTVMFCDLVDSTGIAARLDAEEWWDLVGAYLDVASTAVMEMGGKVAKKHFLTNLPH